MNRTWRNWAPAVAITAVVGAGALVVPLTANAAVDLPDLTAVEVLELATSHSVDTLSGTIEQTSDLGLPDLSLLGGAGGSANGTTGGANAAPGATSDADTPSTPGASVLELLTAPHTARVYLAGPSQARIQVLDDMAERNVILNGTDLWFYDSEDNAAVHATLPDRTLTSEDIDYLEGLPDVPTPDQLAAQFLEKADPTTEVSVGPDRSVAGRAAYQLILTPRADDTLIASITVDVDGDTGLPLAVSVAAADSSEPAFSVAYTDISFDAPPAGIFDFTPPAGATVTEAPDHAREGDPGTAESHDGDPSNDPAENSSKPTVTGTGWGTVLEFPAGDFPANAGELTGMIDQLSTPVEAGRLLQTRLLNILLTDDGRVLVGSVPADRLQAVADGE
ncbi:MULTISPECIES: LolA family protein [unclassified Arthrobacter]|uniref:LolA family protein n=1 Tax=unclassified Arthrobacter TaxID=235627 RepID=UPI001491E54B|nr:MULTISPECIES: DUF2092 domain-containing protein [unclassified Arthrobacter]MBE0010411.1 DUF2092 domain-containing protein [Arthrobacter sp. AET 35A]NOJ59147.1 DUF2092 domain-containing protein [Arthrobacter sp. 260]NOJ64266.1 DUF2092 domain-containing protein [Arthrobacter sp. 147(2020)]